MKDSIKKRGNEAVNDTLTTEQWLKFVDEISSALGSFIIAFNYLDQAVTESILALTSKRSDELETKFFILISEKSFIQRLLDLENLLYLQIRINKKPETLKTKASQLIVKIKAMNSIRNSYVHADWYNTGTEENDTLVKSKTKLDKMGIYHEYFRSSSDIISENEDECDILSDEMLLLIEEINMKEITGPNKPPAAIRAGSGSRH